MPRDGTGKSDLMDSKTLNEICLDFCVKDMTRAEIMTKYKLSITLYILIHKKYKLLERKQKYREKVIDKSIEQCSRHQAKIVSQITSLFSNHVDNVAVLGRKQKYGALTHSQITDLVAIYTIVSKEQRLDNGQATSNIHSKIEVAMPDGYPVISDNKVVKPPPLSEKKIIEIEAVRIKNLELSTSPEREAVEILQPPPPPKPITGLL